MADNDGRQRVHLTVFSHPEYDCHHARLFATMERRAVPVYQSGEAAPMGVHCRAWVEGMDAVSGRISHVERADQAKRVKEEREALAKRAAATRAADAKRQKETAA